MTASESFKTLSRAQLALCAIFLSVKVVGHGTTHKRSFEAYEQFSLVKLNEVWWLKFDLYLFCILLWDLCYKYIRMYTFWYYKFISIVLDNTISPVFPFRWHLAGFRNSCECRGVDINRHIWNLSFLRFRCFLLRPHGLTGDPQAKVMTWNGQMKYPGVKKQTGSWKTTAFSNWLFSTQPCFRRK